MIKDKIASFKNTVINNPSFTVKEQLGYAGGIFGNAMGQDSIGTFDDKFIRKFMFTEEHYNLITIIDNILMFLGFIAPPVAGSILDTPVSKNKKTPTKILTGTMPIPFAITSMLLFLVPSANVNINFAWLLIFRFIFNTVDTFYDLSLNTLSLRMTNNANDRKNFYTVATLASSLGSMLPGWVIPIIVGRTDEPNSQKWLYFFCALIFCILGLASMYAPYFTLEEKLRVVERPEKTAIVWNKQTIMTLLHCRSFLIMELATFFEQIRQLSYKLLNYMYEDVFDQYSLKSIIDAVSGALSYVGLAAVPFLGKRFSARTIVSGGFGYTGIFYALIGSFAIKFDLSKIRKFRYVIGIMIGLAGMPNNAISASKKIIVGDATDYMEWYSEKKYGTPIRSEGLVSAAQSIFGNIFNIIRTNIYNIMFQKLGYKSSADSEEKVVQTEGALKGIFLMFTLCGVIGNALASISYLFDNYTGKTKEAIYTELTEMRAKRAGDGDNEQSEEHADTVL